MSPPHLRLNNYREKYLKRLLNGGLPNGHVKTHRPTEVAQDTLGRPHKKLIGVNSLLQSADKTQSIRTVTPQDTGNALVAEISL